MTLGRTAGLSIALLMVVVGGVWFGQGNGWIGGSSMTGDSFWATAGGVTAGLGVALAIVVIGRARRTDGNSELDKRYGGSGRTGVRRAQRLVPPPSSPPRMSPRPPSPPELLPPEPLAAPERIEPRMLPSTPPPAPPPLWPICLAR